MSKQSHAPIRVRYFAAARDLASASEEAVVLDTPVATVADAFEQICRVHTRLLPYRTKMAFAVNGELVRGTHTIHAGDELCVLPPVAGGSDALLVGLRTAPLSIDEVIAAVRHDAAGGIAVFLGVVRNHSEGKRVTRLDYEAYPELAVQEMTRALEIVMHELPLVRVAALHRVGSLQVGDVAVVIAASAPHREEAFRACRLAIDRIKESAPIWKHELADDGSAAWVNLE